MSAQKKNIHHTESSDIFRTIQTTVKCELYSKQHSLSVVLNTLLTHSAKKICTNIFFARQNLNMEFEWLQRQCPTHDPAVCQLCLIHE